MKYLLDTVTLSELRRGKKAHPGVIQWQQTVADVWISVITLNEIRYGLKKVERSDPPFAKILAAWYDHLLTQTARFRFLPVDRAIAELAADFRFEHSTSINDSLIAATAAVHGLTLVTRNIDDFAPTRVPILNPWDKVGI
ncbi:MAG: type II toxin-antitoxin system VapC family toxin [Chthoniobacterales bacterium]